MEETGMKILMLMMVSCFPMLALAQAHETKISPRGNPCCSVSAISTEAIGASQFAVFAHDNNFAEAHTSPHSLAFVPERGNIVTFKTPDGIDGRAFEVKSTKPTDKVVFMFHEWWGVNEYIQQEAERLQKELGNVTVLAIDLFDGKVTTSPEEAGKFVSEMKTERAIAIIKGALAYVGPKAHLGTLGWCFGGSWSFQGALIGGMQTAACAMYYGMPEFDVERLKTLQSPVLGIFAKRDGWITPTKVKEFEKAMKQANKKLTVKMYDAVHAFANPSNPKFDKEAAADAHKHTIEFFKKYLQQ